MEKVKLIIVVLLVLAVVFSVITVAINSSFDFTKPNNTQNNFEDLPVGDPTGNVQLVVYPSKPVGSLE